MKDYIEESTFPGRLYYLDKRNSQGRRQKNSESAKVQYTKMSQRGFPKSVPPLQQK